MKKIILVHGWDGASDRDWFLWVADEIKKLGYDVACPDFPNTETPTIKEQVPFLADIVDTPDADTYFIGHSIGCQTIMRYLETVGIKVGGAIFVAGWFDLENLEDEEAEEIARSWIETPIDTEKVKNNLGFSVVVLGDNDEWVPYAATKKKFERLLGSEVVTVANGGHITSDDGFGPFPLLIEIVNKKIH